jgi:hypothetical protein
MKRPNPKAALSLDKYPPRLRVDQAAQYLNCSDDHDRVKKRLLELQGRVHNEPQDAGERRRITSRIGVLLAELGKAKYPSHSLNTILRERFKVIEGVNTITDLETRELLNLVRTLAARLASWKARQSGQPAPDDKSLAHAA